MTALPAARCAGYHRKIGLPVQPLAALNEGQTDLAKYDSPGYLDQLPGFAPANSWDAGQTAPGSDGTLAAQEASAGRASLGSPIVSTPTWSSQTPPSFAHVTVSDTEWAACPDLEPFTRVPGCMTSTPSPVGSGHVLGGANHNPNSAGVNPAGGS